MKYLSSAELEKLTAKEIVEYDKKMTMQQSALIEEVKVWVATKNSVKAEMNNKLLELEIMLLDAENDRAESGWDVLCDANRWVN